MTTPTTIDTDTELSAVNSILGAIGQSPVTTLGTVTSDVTNSATEIANTYANPEIALVYNLLTECNKDIQNEGWHFNTEEHVKVTPDANKNILPPTDALRYDLHEGLQDKQMDVVTRDGKLYDLVEHTNEFDKDLFIDVVTLYKFTDLPSVFQRYIIKSAAVRAATQLVNNPQLVQQLQIEEAKARASCMEYECNMSDASFYGLPHESAYKSYQPFHALHR
tara:strand:+ start:2752 stop:3414 length:663 start_codon:yes stop_codon:yes gene_type:complete